MNASVTLVSNERYKQNVTQLNVPITTNSDEDFVTFYTDVQTIKNRGSVHLTVIQGDFDTKVREFVAGKTRWIIIEYIREGKYDKPQLTLQEKKKKKNLLIL